MKKIILSIACALTLLPATVFAGSKEDTQKSLQMTAIINAAVKEGKAVLIYPCTVGGPAQNLTWGKVGTSKEFVMQGGCYDNEKTKVEALNSLYTHFIIEPGKYYLKNATLEKHQTEHQQYTTIAKQNQKASAGYVQLLNTVFNDKVVEQVWKDAHYKLEDNTYCTHQTVDGYGNVVNNCSISKTYEQYNLKSPAGWYPQEVLRPVDGVLIRSVFDDQNSPLTFEVSALEIAIIDGIKLKEQSYNDKEREHYFADVPTYNWDTTACSKVATDSSYLCPMTNYSFLVAADGKYFLNDVGQYLKKVGWTEKMLANVHYRPLENAMTKIKSFRSDGWALFQSSNH